MSSRRYQVNDVYNIARANSTRLEKKRNATLKSSTAYVDEGQFPDLIFLIPKYISKRWSQDKMSLGDEILASVYMKKNGENGSTWIMDLEVGSQLNLKKRVKNSSMASKHHHKRNYDADIEEDFTAAPQHQSSKREIPLDVLATVKTIEESKGGRKADIVLTF
jgi:hypothetical protein